MTPILGATPDGDLPIDLDALIGAHLGIIANAGGGKSGLIRRLLEQTRGQVQHIILDVEDEFYTLRQRHDYVIAGGPGGDAPATVANAAGLATAALTHGFSLICQLNDLGSAGACEFVHEFLSAMMSAPQDLWRPVLVVIDEAQRFDPTSIRMLTERGRKRGFTAVLASQRLPKIDANIRGDLNNWIMGRVGQSLDRRIMADQLGFTAREANDRLAKIEPRHFWAMGPALSRDPVLFRVGDVETTMVKPGMAKVQTPPPAEALREILAGLAPAEPVQTGENYSEFHSDASSAGEKISIAGANARIADLETERDALRQFCERKDARIVTLTAERDRAVRFLTQVQSSVASAAEVMDGLRAEIGDFTDNSQTVLSNPGGSDVDCSAVRAPHKHSDKARRSDRQLESPLDDRRADTPLNAAARKMLDMLERIAPARVTWASLSAMVGNKARGGNFNTARKAMRESGLIVEDGDTVRSAAAQASGMMYAEAIDLWKSVLTNPAPRMIDALAGKDMSRVQLGEALGIAPRGGNFNTGVAQLIRNGVAIDDGGVLRLADPLPGQSA